MGGGKKRQRQEKTAAVPNNSGSSSGRTKTSSTNNTKKSKNSDLNSFISNLAKKASDSTTKLPSKEERIQKRAAKKQKREQKQQQHTSSRQENTSSRQKNENPHLKLNKQQQQEEQQQQDRKPAPQQLNTDSYTTTSISKKRLRQLATVCKQSIPRQKKSYQKPFDGFDSKRRKTKQLTDSTVQPRPKDYGGLGLARETLWLQLEDPSFTARLEEEFQEHIDGFFGKQRTKAMKKQLDGKMLWRQLQNNKNKNQKIDGKKLNSMTPDQRVEAMLKAGML